MAELALNSALHGSLPRPDHPVALRESTPPVWRGRATMTLQYAEGAYAARGQATEVAGALATAAMFTAHAVLAARGQWVTNEKRLLHDADLRDFDAITAERSPDPEALHISLAEARNLFDSAT